MKQLIKDYIADRRFRSLMLTISAPIILQMLLINGLSFIDMMMIGRLGEAEVAAVGLGNQMFFLVFLIFFGIASGTGIFIAQFWGDRDYEGIHHVLGLSLSGVLIFALPFAAASIAFPEILMRFFTEDALVVKLGSDYLKLIGPSYIFAGISFAFSMSLRSIEMPKIPLIATAVSMTMNTLLNLMLIFGYLGFPAMGVKGAAVATLISRFVELLITLFLVYYRKLPVAAKFFELFGFDLKMVKRFFVTAGPVLLNEVVWAMGMIMYKYVFARMGTDVIAAANLTESVQGLFFIILMGTGNTAAIMIGKKIGEGSREEAYKYSEYFILQAVVLGLILGILMAVTAPVLILLLKLKPGTILLTEGTLFAMSFLVPLKSFNLHMIVGVFRSGGDTAFSFFVDTAGVWGVGVPMAFLTGLYLKMELPAVYLLIGTEELFKTILIIFRFKNGKWLKDLRRRN